MTVTGPSITVNPWRRGLAGARRRGAWISRGARGGRHCEKDGPRWRPRKWDPRSSQSAPIPSRLVARVSVIDPHHPLFGQRLDLSSHASGRRPGWVSLVLADGRRRWVPRAATDLDSGRESSSSHVLPRVSVRTLLPLMQYVRTLLSNPPKVSDGLPLDSDLLDARADPSEPAAGAGAESVADDDAGGSAAFGTAGGSSASADVDGDRRCSAERGG